MERNLSRANGPVALSCWSVSLGLAASALCLAACVGTVSSAGGGSTGGSKGSGNNGAATGGSGVGTTGGSTGTGGRGGSSAGAAGSTGAGGSAATGGAGTTGTGGSATGGNVGTGGTSASGQAGAGGAADAHAFDHCVYGFAVDSRDGQITSSPDHWTSPTNSAVDLMLPAGVLAWMHELVWEQSHDAWHDIRRCNTGSSQTSYGVNVCAQKALVPAHQECADAEDGYEFLVMHRHMIQSLREAFPTHASLFDGFPHFPFNATDVPQEWQSRWGTGWSQQIIDTAKTLEAIESNLSMFPTEGDLGKYIQCGVASSGASSIHGALHFKWVVNDSPYSLGKQPVNIDNYMFWKLHGWIDEIWERYRAAKGLTDDEPKLQQTLHDQCVQMHDLGLLFDPSLATRPDSPLPVEHGYFHETVRPILEQICSGCHGDASPQANMSLGGHISSADIVKGLVNATTSYGGQFKRIVPNNVNQSWLYLKVSGMAMSANCTGANCNTEVMPPTGQVTLTQDQLGIIANWINMGAPPPTQ